VIIRGAGTLLVPEVSVDLIFMEVVPISGLDLDSATELFWGLQGWLTVLF
jgi:hypothetical protein